MNGGRSRVTYYYDKNVGNFYYGLGHPMKPQRLRMAHDLVVAYGLHKHMKIVRPELLGVDGLTAFHGDAYVYFLKNVNMNNKVNFQSHMQRYNVGEDCPVFPNLYQFCQISASGSVVGAYQLNKRSSDICINWSGGLHHAKQSEASGFCYINDIVLAILELLKCHKRVLYIDIDVHHGDGVEEAFYTSDRVMTVSFHKYGEFFPGTGSIDDIGADKGKYYALNVPLSDGIDDDTYYDSVFKPVITKVIEVFCPNAIVLQCGADSLVSDRLGCFNLTIQGHGRCVKFIKKLRLPLLLLGGGGYTIRNVARCWAYETSLATGVELENDLPYCDYFDHYSPDYTLHISPSTMINLNSPKLLESLRCEIFKNLSSVPPVPSVEMQDIPKSLYDDDIDEDIEKNDDVRLPQEIMDRHVQFLNEFSDSEDEGEDNRKCEKVELTTDTQNKECSFYQFGVNDVTEQPVISFMNTKSQNNNIEIDTQNILPVEKSNLKVDNANVTFESAYSRLKQISQEIKRTREDIEDVIDDDDSNLSAAATLEVLKHRSRYIVQQKHFDISEDIVECPVVEEEPMSYVVNEEIVSDINENQEFTTTYICEENIEAIENIDNIDNIEDIEDIEGMVEDIERMEDIEDIGNVEDIENDKNIETMDNIGTIENIETIENIDTLENIGTIETIETIENFETIEDIETIENIIVEDQSQLEIETADGTELICYETYQHMSDSSNIPEDYTEVVTTELQASDIIEDITEIVSSEPSCSVIVPLEAADEQIESDLESSDLESSSPSEPSSSDSYTSESSLIDGQRYKPHSMHKPHTSLRDKPLRKHIHNSPISDIIFRLE